MRDGVIETIEHLKEDFNVSSKEKSAAQLILKYSEWVLLRDPLRSLSIFTLKRLKTKLSWSSVCECLEQADAVIFEQIRRSRKNGKSFKAPPMLLQRYLESVLKEKEVSDDDERCELYTRLALQYVLGLSISSSNSNDKEILSEIHTHSSQKLREIVMNRDIRLNAETLLKHIKASKLSLIDEIAMLRGRLGRHKEAIEELLRVRSVQDAETYCLRNNIQDDYDDDGGGKMTQQQPMIVLLNVLFRPVESSLPRTKSEYRAHAMTLLMKHAQPRPPSWSGLDPVKILDVFPDSMPLNSALPYFALSVPCLHHRLRHSQATKHLCKYDTQILLRSKLLSAQNRKIVIDKDSKCAISGEPIAENNVFAVYPNGRTCLYHHVHGKDLTTDPITGKSFGMDGVDALPKWDASSAMGDEEEVDDSSNDDSSDSND